jgi:hypothetical protein
MVMNVEYTKIWRMGFAVCLKPCSVIFLVRLRNFPVRIAGKLCEAVTGNLLKNIIATVWKSKVQCRSFNLNFTRNIC